jgi:hypothetical protein
MKRRLTDYASAELYDLNMSFAVIEWSFLVRRVKALPLQTCHRTPSISSVSLCSIERALSAQGLVA